MTVLYSENPVMFKSNPGAFLLCLVLIPAFGIGLVFLIWWHLTNKATKLTVTDRDVLLERGLLSKERCEVNINGIRTTKVTQTLSGRMFGFGSIEIFTAGDQAEIAASGMPNPNEIRNIIKKQQDA